MLLDLQAPRKWMVLPSPAATHTLDWGPEWGWPRGPSYVFLPGASSSKGSRVCRRGSRPKGAKVMLGGARSRFPFPSVLLRQMNFWVLL